MFKKYFIIAVVMGAIVVSGGLFYWFLQYNNEVTDESIAYIPSQPIIKWQEITITGDEPKIAIHINMPRIIIHSYDVNNEINLEIRRHIEYLKDYFIRDATMAAIDNGETNILNIETEILLATPRLISLAFTSAERFAGNNNSEPERTFMVFDLVNNKVMVEGAELFPDDLSWARAVTIMKKVLLSDYKGDPSCDLSFAPKHNGFAVSCIGVDYSHGHKRLSLTGDISISMIQEFLAPSVLSDIIQ